jgi:homoserine O-acetyltransferase
MTRQKVLDELKKAREAKGGGFDANDKVRQVQAMMSLDVSAPYGGSLEQAAGGVKARVFIVVAKLDHVVTPGPALEFAQLLRSKVMVLEGDCGHLATACEANKLNLAVDEFLRQ